MEEAAEEPVTNNIFDRKMSDFLYGLFIKLVVIIVMFTLSAVIRSKSGPAPVPVPVALVLAVLLTAVPMLTSTILEGWGLVQLSYLTILFIYFVLRSKKFH